MTTPSKIHRQAPGKPAGETVCGRKAAAARITSNADDVSCDVCIVTQLRQAGGTSKSSTVLDRLTDTLGDDRKRHAVATKTRNTGSAEDAARNAALKALAARYLDEFLDLYREALDGERGHG